ncbi:hypothetical protein BCT62_21135 [Vibrio splendidus]|uniref:hypothetical protein n=1 Tax=Vibrio splendidus TaxID=29497 RepID=UPI000C825D0D|nr:hypothetical protein [Vibrio splendidus]PMM04646.1 hypothetical protein BCT62_21135 [Vibrio splendidus]
MYFQEMKKAASALDGAFFYSVVSRLATLELKSPKATKAYQSKFESTLELKTINQLSNTERRIGSKSTMQDLADDIKYLLHGKHLDQFMRENEHYSSMPKPEVKTDSRAFREWLKSNKSNLAV